MTNIKSVEPIGKHQTFDLEVDHPDHQFYLANGVLTSNSHAVAYAIDSYWCAWLMTYHEEEWVRSYLESMSSTPAQRLKAFSEVKALGWTIVPIDINLASDGWIALPGKRLMPSIVSASGVGSSAFEEIAANRPYTSLEELLWTDDFEWKHSKFNKKALEALVKIGAFDSVGIVGEGKMFKNYHQMHEVLFGSHVESITKKRKGVVTTEDEVVEHFNALRRRTKSDPHAGVRALYELLKRYDDIEEWTPAEKAKNLVEVFGTVDATMIVDPDILDSLNRKNITSIDDVEFGSTDVVWFITVIASPKKGKPTGGVVKTTRNGKQYVQAYVMGSSGSVKRVTMWGIKHIPEPYVLYVAEVKRDDYGFSTSASKMRALT